jgi:hypothetical protein
MGLGRKNEYNCTMQPVIREKNIWPWGWYVSRCSLKKQEQGGGGNDREKVRRSVVQGRSDWNHAPKDEDQEYINTQSSEPSELFTPRLAFWGAARLHLPL